MQALSFSINNHWFYYLKEAILKIKKIFGLFKEKTHKIDIIIFFLAIAVIAVGMGPQL